MGKTEENPHRFRRKAKASDPAQEAASNSAFSPSSSVDACLCENLLDPESASSSPSQTSRLPLGLGTTNGPCDAELTDRHGEGESSSPAVENGVDEGTESTPQTAADMRLSSRLPAELRGLPCSETTPLSSNHSLHLSACHVQKEDAVILLLFLHNSSSSDIQHMRFELRSDELEVQESAVGVSVLTSCARRRLNVPPSFQVSPCAGVMPGVRSGAVAVCRSALSVERPSVRVEVAGVVSYSLPVGTPLSLRFSYNLPLSSFIR